MKTKQNVNYFETLAISTPVAKRMAIMAPKGSQNGGIMEARWAPNQFRGLLGGLRDPKTINKRRQDRPKWAPSSDVFRLLFAW